jgi:hypothetical protein
VWKRRRKTANRRETGRRERRKDERETMREIDRESERVMRERGREGVRKKKGMKRAVNKGDRGRVNTKGNIERESGWEKKNQKEGV